MECKKTSVCRLCLAVVDVKLEALLKSDFEMLELCLPEIDLELCCDCALCPSCSHCLKTIFFFKMQCLQNEERLRLYVQNCNPQKIDLQRLVECISNMSDDHFEICRCCLRGATEFVSIEAHNTNDNIIISNMFATCIPEMDLKSSNNPVICRICVEGMKQFYAFKSKCLQCEEQIISFKEDNNVQFVDLLDLVSILVQQEIHFENVDLDEKVENEGPESKREVKEDTENSSQVQDISEDADKLELIGNVKPEIELLQCSNFQFVNCGVDLVNTLPDRLQGLSKNATNLLIDKETSKWYTCDTCSYQSRYKNHLERHKQIHEAESECHKGFKCLKCGFISKYKHALLKHSTLEHGEWFICEECQYQTKWKRCFNQHMLNHTGGQIWHHCEICTYKTKWKSHLKRHMVTHQ